MKQGYTPPEKPTTNTKHKAPMINFAEVCVSCNEVNLSTVVGNTDF